MKNMPLRIAIAVLAIATAAAFAVPARGAKPRSQGPVGLGLGSFHAECAYSHRLSDDPIVFPRGPGASHPHDFFGSMSTDAFSTPLSIQAGPTSCTRTNSTVTADKDRSAYWVPTLYVANQPVVATTMGAYYKSGVRYTQSIKPFPKDFKMIAGSAAGGPQEIDAELVWYFECPGGTLVNGSSTVAPTCKTPRIDLSIRFPDCWDGVNIDTADHKSHVAYSRKLDGAAARTCPPTHPTLLPQLEISFRYPTTAGPSLRLASGAINTAHADFMNGWDQPTLQALVENCLVVDKYCGGGDLPAH